MKSRLNYKILLKYLFVLTTTLALSRVNPPNPLQYSSLVAFLYCGFNPFATFFTYNFCELLFFNKIHSLFRLLESFATCFIFFLYKNKKPRFELTLYVLICLIPQLIYNKITVEKALYTSIIMVFSFISITSIKVFTINGFKYKLFPQELVSISIFMFLTGFGFINLFGIGAYKGITILLILLTAYIFADSSTLAFSLILSLPYALYDYSLAICGVYTIFGCVSMLTATKSRLLSTISVTAVEVTLYYLTYVYDYYSYATLIVFIFSASVFAFIPKSFVNLLKDKFLRFREKHLTKQAINRVRSEISSKLFEISVAFRESFSAISNLKCIILDEEEIKCKIADNIYELVCKNCSLKNTCQYKFFPSKEIVYKLANIGIAKGKLTLVDMPVEFTRGCSFTNNVLFQFNKDLQIYKDKLQISKAFNDERELLSLQSISIANMIKEIALSVNKQLSFSSERERKIISELHKNGILITEILVFGEGFTSEITIVLDKEEFNKNDVCYVISQCENMPFAIYQTRNISQTLMSINLKVAPKFDAVFGISTRCKKGNVVCGDTHTLSKLNVGEFIIAINDGMGSGEVANKLSSTVLNLMESFFKAGLRYDLTLKTLNKILSISDLESFSCLDLAIVNLFTGKVRFVKIGSPYGYILEKDNIKIVESSSLPLGVIDDATPISSETTIKGGDVIVLTSDGVSDAFGSSSDFLDYLKNQPIKNPQKLSDSILKQALDIDSEPKDDMTVLCVKIFEKNKAS